MPKVLLVDDEANIRWTMAEILKREGYEAITAPDFDGALSLLDANEIDAAIVDIVLPPKSGIEILKVLRDRKPDVPVIMITGEPNISQIPEIVRGGAYDFIPKPVVRDALIRAVRKAVETKRLRDEKARLERQNREYAEGLEQAVQERTRELEDAHGFLNTVLDSSTEYAIIALNADARILLFNHGAELMFGYKSAEVLGRAPGEMIAGTFIPGSRPFLEWARRAEGLGRHQEEVELRRADDARFVASVTMTPIRAANGAVVGYLSVIKDLTAERENARRLQQMSEGLARNEKIAALGRMAAQLAHEVKNPLAGLRLYSLHLKGKIAGKIPPSEEGLVDRIIDGINQLSETAERVLSLARPITVTPRPTELNQIITASLALVEPQLRAKRINVTLDLCETGAPGNFDEPAMRSTLINLILNSVQAMSEGGELRLSTSLVGGSLRVEISDNGCGMSEEQAEHVFEPFYTTNSQGMGLGLYFAATVVERHGGTVDVRSRRLEGTTISITFPAAAEGLDEAMRADSSGR